MTAAKPVDRSEVRATAVRLFRWLRRNGHTTAKNVEALVADADENGIRHPKNSPPGVITEALTVAYGAWTVATHAIDRKAIAELRLFRPRLQKLVRALTAVDLDFAARGLEAAEPTFAELGSRIVSAVNAVSQRLETRDDRKRVPTGKAQWKRFTGSVSHELRKLGMEWPELVSLFPDDPEKKGRTGERLRKRAARFKQRVASIKSDKKLHGRSGAPERPQHARRGSN